MARTTKFNYSPIVIIYNPLSTSGKAEVKAQRLADRLRRQGYKTIQVLATEHAGHAEELGYQAVLQHSHPLIISVSGDGGYNEVVNGVMRAKQQKPGHQPVTAILPAGNANDHRHSVRKRPLGWSISRRAPENLSLLKLSITTGHEHAQRYAHSYIGLGVTSLAADLINQETYTRWQSFTIIMSTLFFFKPVTIAEADGKIQRYDNLVFMLGNHISRVFRVEPKADLNTEEFRILSLPHQARWYLLYTLAKLLVFGVKRPPSANFYQFSLPREAIVHLDGETTTLPAGSQLAVTVVPEALQTLR